MIITNSGGVSFRRYSCKNGICYDNYITEHKENREFMLNAEHDLMLYDFLKKQFEKYENDGIAIKEQVDNYYNHRDETPIKADWEYYKAEYQKRKNSASYEVNMKEPKIHSSSSTARIDKNRHFNNIKPREYDFQA